MKKNRTFGSLKPISTVLPDNVKKLIKNKPFSDFNTLKNSWDKIVGNDISNKCDVIGVQKINRKNILYLRVKRSYLIDIDYSRDQIIEKVNSYLGFEFASKIFINIKENKCPQVKNKKLNLNKKTKSLIDSICDEELKQKLSDFTKIKND